MLLSPSAPHVVSGDLPREHPFLFFHRPVIFLRQPPLLIILLSTKGYAARTGGLPGHTPGPHPGARDTSGPGRWCMCRLSHSLGCYSLQAGALTTPQGSPVLPNPLIHYLAFNSRIQAPPSLEALLVTLRSELTLPLPSCPRRIPPSPTSPHWIINPSPFYSPQPPLTAFNCTARTFSNRRCLPLSLCWLDFMPFQSLKELSNFLRLSPLPF